MLVVINAILNHCSVLASISTCEPSFKCSIHLLPLNLLAGIVFLLQLSVLNCLSKKSYYSKCVSCGFLEDQPIVKTTIKGTSTVFSPAAVSIAPNCRYCDSKMQVNGGTHLLLHFKFFRSLGLSGLPPFMIRSSCLLCCKRFLPWIWPLNLVLREWSLLLLRYFNGNCNHIFLFLLGA